MFPLPWQTAFSYNVPNFHYSELISSGVLNYSLWNHPFLLLSLYSITKFCYFSLCKVSWMLSCDIPIALIQFHFLITSGFMSSPDWPLEHSLLVFSNHCQIYVPEHTGFLSVLLLHVALTASHNQYCWYIIFPFWKPLHTPFLNDHLHLTQCRQRECAHYIFLVYAIKGFCFVVTGRRQSQALHFQPQWELCKDSAEKGNSLNNRLRVESQTLDLCFMCGGRWYMGNICIFLFLSILLWT